ncbi:ATP-binding protein, partial [Mesorhizobium sp. M7A.F.Ca.US.006.04.2.1]|uniref:Swt1 family HEPN domain-containing protein n=1 Tax=Mesorhizobium sp. M7A.F.Ca.US.006.04.2.1 TaxID=2496696 RepID=UPI000FD4C8CB
MSHEIEGTKRVRDTLDFTLKSVLDGFVEANMEAKHGQRWLHYASRSSGQGQNDTLDVYGLCKTILDNWNEVFGARFDRKHVNKARRLVSTVFEARNATAHLNVPLSDPEALSFLWAIVELAMLLKAPEKTIETLKAVYGAQRSTGIEAGRIDPATPTEPKLTVEPGSAQQMSFNSESGVAKALKPWIDVALPHPDVIANRFKEAEFAADLFAVDAGYAGEGYATPNSFYGITFLTEGLKRVLTTATQRLGANGGDPVIGLQTAFGGGKTHTMLAIFHLVKHLRDGGDPRGLPGLSDILDRAGVNSLPKPKMAVFVGSADGPDVSLKLNEGPRVHTAWGYIAWRLAGEPGLALVAEAEAARTSPGSRIMVEVFKLAGPSVILLDELTMFARQLDDDRFEAFLSFIQSLTEAAKMVPGILIVGSLVESKAEAGGPRGEAALLRLEKIFGRVQSAWLPASGDETYEIIRRRLFQPLDAEGEMARDETVRAFHDLYKKNPAEFPPEAREARYLELLRLSYPSHPELCDRLSK